MTSNSESTHKLLESNVAEKYKQKGYEVIVEPQSKELPFDLGTYRPDLLVKKSKNEGYIIEVKSTATRTPVERYREISEMVSQYPGWRFLLVTGQDTLPSIPEGVEGNLLTWEQILRRKEQAERLISLGEIEGAFSSLWGILEALMRRQAERVSLPIEQFPTSSLIKHLYSQGELSMEQFDKALALQAIRNRFAHGFQAPELGKPLAQLQEVVNDLLRLWGPQ